ncbi:hypothetical protein FJT64_018715 [Amphibalanus amphitrite]|uniref:Uncharacterized protein n=1 Tax=Amphibalanus amphitrite TaxID=1232801 RepID=A0A6A4WST1_AMPAM|nr:hypothetical protein FJT64_018715 [Amphibalanus amphitrite]
MYFHNYTDINASVPEHYTSTARPLSISEEPFSEPPEQPSTSATPASEVQDRLPAADASLELTLPQQWLATLLVLICIGSILAGLVFRATLKRYLARFHAPNTVFDSLLLVRATILLGNVLMELVLFAVILRPSRESQRNTCFALSLLSAASAFTITYLTMWLSLVRLLLLAAARWTPKNAWRLANNHIYGVMVMLYAPSAAYFSMKYRPAVLFFVCAGLTIENRPSPNNTALGVLFLISTAANTLLLYADATLPPAPPRHRNVLSARRFALLTLCEQLLVLLWVPASALTAGVTRALLIRVLMIGQAGLMDTVGLALISPQLRLVLLGRRRRPVTPRRRAHKVAPVPTIRLELI